MSLAAPSLLGLRLSAYHGLVRGVIRVTGVAGRDARERAILAQVDVEGSMAAAAAASAAGGGPIVVEASSPGFAPAVRAGCACRSRPTSTDPARRRRPASWPWPKPRSGGGQASELLRGQAMRVREGAAGWVKGRGGGQGVLLNQDSAVSTRRGEKMWAQVCRRVDGRPPSHVDGWVGW